MNKDEKLKKPFLTYEEQIEKLVEKKLEIKDKGCALKLLKENSYFDIISGYKRPFKRDNGDYKPHTTFDDIYGLYRYDDKLRALFLKYILKIEKHIKSLTSYAFCSEYGADQSHYLKTTNYDYSTKNQSRINKFVSDLGKIVNKPNTYSYIDHQRRHGNVPLWVLMKALTLGAVSKMYSFLPQKIQKNVSIDFEGVDEIMLERILNFLARIRNVCAHNERLYDYKYKKVSIRETELHRKLGLTKKNSSNNKGKNDLFAVIIVFKYMLDKNDFEKFINRFDYLTNVFLDKTNIIQKTQLYSYMGLPDNWKEVQND